MSSVIASKKRLLRMVECYGTARAQEALADSRDAGMATLKRHHAQISKALADIGAEIDELLAADAALGGTDLFDVQTSVGR